MAPTTRSRVSLEKDTVVRRQTRSSVAVSPQRKKARLEEAAPDNDDDSSSSDESQAGGFVFNGIAYDSYQEMVEAKRQRNQQVLMESGLLTLQKPATKPPSKPRRTAKPKQTPSRRSNRLKGVPSDGRFVEDERAGNFIVRSERTAGVDSDTESSESTPRFFANRLHDGSSDLSIAQVMEHVEPKFKEDDSVAQAEAFGKKLLTLEPQTKAAKNSSPRSVARASNLNDKQLKPPLKQLTVDQVEKVTPGRIYSVSTCPLQDQLVVSVGDKEGYVGLWNATDPDKHQQVHLFRLHNRPVCNLLWPTSTRMICASYDGTLQSWDVERACFHQVFATYDGDSYYHEELGFDLYDNGWIQQVSLDSRHPDGFFLATSGGMAYHLDLRLRGRITMHQQLSDKKINSLSLHPDGQILASAGLDGMVQLWDIRNLGDSRAVKKRTSGAQLPKFQAGKSINAFFSPSGSALVATTMNDTLDVFHNFHQASLKPTKRVRHSNQTGRWLSTFMAQWHPELDVFCVGSMEKPRTIHLFDDKGTMLQRIQGEALTAVASRCCFGPASQGLVVVGGNSSGRVTIAR